VWNAIAPRSDACGLSGRLAQVRREPVELVLPEPAVLVEPAGGAVHGGGQEAHASHAPVTPALHETCPLEHNEMLADGGERHGEGACELANGRLSGCEPSDDRAPRGIGERAKDGIKTSLGVNHMV